MFEVAAHFSSPYRHFANEEEGFYRNRAACQLHSRHTFINTWKMKESKKKAPEGG
jgi:hypothetical protein